MGEKVINGKEMKGKTSKPSASTNTNARNTLKCLPSVEDFLKLIFESQIKTLKARACRVSDLQGQSYCVA